MLRYGFHPRLELAPKLLSLDFTGLTLGHAQDAAVEVPLANPHSKSQAPMACLPAKQALVRIRGHLHRDGFTGVDDRQQQGQ